MSKLTSLLKVSDRTRARVRGTEDDLFALFKEQKCSTKAAMIKTLAAKGWSQADIAKTLQTYGVLGKSARQHVRNTLDK